MRVFADHCISNSIIEILEGFGLQVERARDAGLASSSDEEIFDYILKTDQVLLTFDKDFCNIIRFDIQHSVGVIIFDIAKMTKVVLFKRVIDVFKQIQEVELKGRLMIVKVKEVSVWPD